jgi:VIT1/CCC1 family predicted Fe2+/Mn2+ transporter
MENSTQLQHNKNEKLIHNHNNPFSRIQRYLSEFVYGGIDGSVTTFAVVAGSTGANFDVTIIIILGLANLFADGISMSVGSYLSHKTDLQNFQKHKNIEIWEVDNYPEIEKEEIRQIYKAKGFEGETLEKVVETITSNKERWVDTMMKEELQMIPSGKSPAMIGLMTYLSFLVVGFIPLLTYIINFFSDGDTGSLFLYSCIFTSAAFILIGYLKSFVTQSGKIKGVLETLFLGGIAALVAYFAGSILEKIIS